MALQLIVQPIMSEMKLRDLNPGAVNAQMRKRSGKCPMMCTGSGVSMVVMPVGCTLQMAMQAASCELRAARPKRRRSRLPVLLLYRIPHLPPGHFPQSPCPLSHLTLEHGAAKTILGRPYRQSRASAQAWGEKLLSVVKWLQHNKVTVVACMMLGRHEICPSKMKQAVVGDDGSALHFSRHEKKREKKHVSGSWDRRPEGHSKALPSKTRIAKRGKAIDLNQSNRGEEQTTDWRLISMRRKKDGNVEVDRFKVKKTP